MDRHGTNGRFELIERWNILHDFAGVLSRIGRR
jgi:hypothetical protein